VQLIDASRIQTEEPRTIIDTTAASTVLGIRRAREDGLYFEPCMYCSECLLTKFVLSLIYGDAGLNLWFHFDQRMLGIKPLHKVAQVIKPLAQGGTVTV